MSLARLPRPGLAALAMLRGRPDVVVKVDNEFAWIAWQPAGEGDRDEVAEALLPVSGIVFYRGDGTQWYPAGGRLPTFEVDDPGNADAPGVPLHQAIVPEPIRWEPPRTDWRPTRPELVRDERPRPASALVSTARALLSWAESAPTARLEALLAARSGDRILLMGRRLPPIAGLGRYWGRRVLVPLGFRIEPDLAEHQLAEALDLGDDDLALIGPDCRVEVVPGAAIGPLSRTAARLMAGVTSRLSLGGGGEVNGR